MKKLILVFLLFFSHSIYAVTVKPVLWFNTAGTTTYNSAQSYFFNNTQAACQNLYDRTYKDTGTLVSAIVSGTLGGSASGTCNLSVRLFSNGGTGVYTTPIALAYVCPAGFTLDGATGNILTRTCSGTSCPSGLTAGSSGSCEDNCAPLKGQTVNVPINCSSASFPSMVCLPNNCAGSSSSAATGYDKVKSCWFGQAKVKLTGVTCSGEPSSSNFTNPTAATPAPSDKPETECIKQGKSYGTVNGSVVCVGAGTSGATPITNSASTSTTETQTSTDGKTSTSTTKSDKTSTEDAGIVTTTEKKTNADGSTIDIKTEMPKDEFCKLNPNDKLCKGVDESESKFSGTCEASFSCEGDAIQCAIALKQHQAYCDAVEQNSQRDDFLTSVTETEGQKLKDFIPESKINLPADLSNQQLLSHAGLGDLTFPLGTQSVVIPLSKLNPGLEFLGTVVKLFSYLFSAIIIFGRRGS